MLHLLKEEVLVSEGAPEKLIDQLGKTIIEVNGPDTNALIERLELKKYEYMIEGGVLLIRIKDYETNKLDLYKAHYVAKQTQ